MENPYAQLKPGDRVIWLYSRKRSFVVGHRVKRIPAVIIRVCKRKIRLRAQLPGMERTVNVDPDNVIFEREE
ncbi:MAG: hypothetical protein JXB23_06860 [Candidatus Aminicenantes bacterium]|nr:hypothetical protein [Candidatus Aminicenantes bacterium]